MLKSFTGAVIFTTALVALKQALGICAQRHLQKSRLSGGLKNVHNAEIRFYITDTVNLVDCSSRHCLHSCNVM